MITKKIPKSLLVAVSFEVVGIIINLISYYLRGEFFLAQRLYGGEWEGQRGFGMVLNKVWPLLISDSEPIKVSSWISFDFISLYATLVIGFYTCFIICTIINIIFPSKKKKRK